MNRDAQMVFAAIDSFDPENFVAHLTDDVVFRFGNADPQVGNAAVKDGVSGFFSTISGLTHHILDVWDVGSDTTVVRVEVEYRRQDGETVYTPNIDVLKWRGDKVYDWQIVIDIAPVYAPIDEVPDAVRRRTVATAGS